MKLYPATITRRFWAFVIDYILMSIIESSILYMFVSVSPNLPDWMNYILAFLFIGIFIFYIPLCETFLDGRTMAKMMLGIRVVRTDGSPVSGVHCLQRYLMLYIDLVATMGMGGLLCAMITSKRQRLGDLAADTMVVQVRPQGSLSWTLFRRTSTILTEDEKDRYRHLLPDSIKQQPLALSEKYRAIECDIAYLRTHKGNEVLIDYLERLLSSTHLTMFRHKCYTIADMIAFTLRSIPRAVWEARWAVLASLIIVIVAYAIGLYSQSTDPDFFRQLFGDYYADVTIENIRQGKPMGIYGSEDEWHMFFKIFFNNMLVCLIIYVMGLFTFVGPLFMLLNNFVSFATFDMFFTQQGLMVDAIVVPNEHGVLELSSIIMAGGASILLGTGWLFPGKRTRLQAFSRSARHSILIIISTLPMLLVAAFIESFITRHTEWPMAVKLAIITISLIIIIAYYVMLPFLARRH